MSGWMPSPGLRHIALAAFWFSVMSLLVKLAGRTIPSQEVVFFRAAVSLVLSWVLLKRAGRDPWGNRKGLLLLRGLLGFLALTAFFYSVIHLPLADATVIHYTNPMFTALLAAWFLGERLEARTLVCVGAGLVGVVLIARPAFLFGGIAGAPEPRYVAVALTAAILSAAAYVVVRKLGSTEDPLVVVLYFPLVAVPMSIPWVVPVWVWPTPVEWILLVSVGITTQIAQVHLTRGLSQEPAGRAMAVGYVQIVFATLWGALVFADLPDAWTVTGATVVLLGILILARSTPSRRPGGATAT